MALTSDDLSRSLGTKKTSINSTATFLVFEPGLYTVSFSASSSGGSDLGLRLPCARLEAVPAPGSGQAFVTTMPLGGWLSTETSAAHVLVVGGRAGALLTIYRASDAVDMPAIEFRAVLKSNDLGADGTKQAAESVRHTEDTRIDLRVSVSLQEAGETLASNGNWSVVRNQKDSVEGFKILAMIDGGAVEFEYQGVMGRDWHTQWFKQGEYCGSRGLQLPMLGFRIRMPAEVASRYAVQYWGIFDGGETVGPIVDGGFCQAGDKPLISMKVECRRLETAVASGPAPTAAKAKKPTRPARSK